MFFEIDMRLKYVAMNKKHMNQLSKENTKLLYRKQVKFIVKKKKTEILDKFHVMRFLL